MATDLDIQLSDLLESYPSVSTPGFQTIITSKKEFAELESDPNEKLPPGRGKYFKHQKLTMRYLRSYPDLFVMSETGTGKSCEILSFAEYTRRELEKAKINPASADEKAAYFKKVIVLVKGQTQKNEFKSQLVCKCSDGRYEEELMRMRDKPKPILPGASVKKRTKESIQMSNITKILSRAGYTVTTYTKFANQLAREYPDTDEGNAKLIQDYSNTIYWIDEGHNLLIDSGESTAKQQQKQHTYAQLWRLFHKAERCKRIISTATPMINDTAELGSLFNLILPENGILPKGFNYKEAPDNDIRVLFPELPDDINPKTATPEEMSQYYQGQFPERYNFNTATADDLEPRFRGRINYVRAAETGAIPVERGVDPKIPYTFEGETFTSQFIIYTSAMSDHQEDGYIRAKVDSENTLHIAERQASNFVFPDGYWGTGITDEERARRSEAKRLKRQIKQGTEEISMDELEEQEFAYAIDEDDFDIDENISDADRDRYRAFRRYVSVRGDRFQATAQLKEFLKNIDSIRALSCKYAAIAELIISEPKGTAFVYSEYVKSSAVLLALCLEGLGFERYNESTSIFLGEDGAGPSGFCQKGTTATPVGGRRIRPGFIGRSQGGPLRYALLTGATTNAQFKSMMDTMNSYENRHGEYIKVIISSKVGRDALNINNVLQIHLADAGWHQSAIYQALSRGLRVTSHEDLINEEKERIRREEPDRDPETARIVVNIYKHSAISKRYAAESIDVKMYLEAEQKDRQIKRIMRIMKQCSIGCHINYKRNVRPHRITDADNGTPACDYQNCVYSCYDPPPDYVDYSTYDVNHVEEVLNEITADLANIFQQRNVLSLEQLEVLLTDYRKKYIIMSLERLITNKVALTDRFGYTTYLREDNGTFYLDRNYPMGLQPSVSMSYYTNGIIAIEERSLGSIVSKIIAQKIPIIISDLESYNDPQYINSRLKLLPIEGQAMILENTLMRYLSGENNLFIQTVRDRYKLWTFELYEPVTEINKAKIRAAPIKQKKGPKRKEGINRRISKINPNLVDQLDIQYDTNTPVVFLHTVYTQVTDNTGFAIAHRALKAEGRLRLLNSNELENGWRDLPEIENTVYNALIQIELAKRFEPYNAIGLYGLILLDNKLRIVDKSKENRSASTDSRDLFTGKECGSWNKYDLVDILWKLQIPQPQHDIYDLDDMTSDDIIQELSTKKINKSPEELFTWDINKLRYYYVWYRTKTFTRVNMCSIIKNRLTELDRLVQ